MDFRDLWRIWLPLLLVTLLSPPLALGIPLLERYLIDQVILGQERQLLVQVVFLYGLLTLLSLIVRLVAQALRSYLYERLIIWLRQRLFHHCERLSLAFSHNEHTGQTTALFVNDVPVIANYFANTLVIIVGSMFALVCGAVLLFALSWQLAVAVAVAPPLVAGLGWIVTRPLRPAARQAADKAAVINQRLHEYLVGIREVVAFGQQGAQERRFIEALQDVLRLRMRVMWLGLGLQSGQSVASLAATVVILGLGGYLVIQGQTTLGTLVAARALFGLVYQPLDQLFGTVGALQTALASADRVYAFLDRTPRVQECPAARDPQGVTGTVAFESVDFAYDAGQPVLSAVSFVARPGEMIALVGPSGAGKSSLVSLIARFYDPSAGRVLLDGIDVRDLTLRGLRGQIGMVFQDTFLFAATIRENIALGRAEATEQEIIAAAHAAHAWEFIERLPEGLDTQVGERGVRLSEGQRQRLAIARAFLRDPRVLILDEPTAALDARSESLVQAALDTLIRGRTTIVIAHRLATVRRADRILVLESGRIAEQGTHQELLRGAGLYRQLYDLQFGPDGQSPTRAPAALVLSG